jgi:hypothetical protein
MPDISWLQDTNSTLVLVSTGPLGEQLYQGVCHGLGIPCSTRALGNQAPRIKTIFSSIFFSEYGILFQASGYLDSGYQASLIGFIIPWPISQASEY